MADLVRSLTPVVTAHGTNTNGSVPDFAALLFIQTPGGTTPLPAAVVGAPYSTTLQAGGGKAPLTWCELAAGSSQMCLLPGAPSALPTGLTLSPGGVISGTPSASGTFSFTAKVTDSTPGTPQTASQTFSLRSYGRATADRDRLRGEPGRRGPDDVRDGHGHRHAGQRDAVDPDRHGRPDGLRALGLELCSGADDGRRFGLPGDGDPDGGGSLAIAANFSATAVHLLSGLSTGLTVNPAGTTTAVVSSLNPSAPRPVGDVHRDRDVAGGRADGNGDFPRRGRGARHVDALRRCRRPSPRRRFRAACTRSPRSTAGARTSPAALRPSSARR